MLDQSVLQAEVYLAVLDEAESFSKAAKRLNTAQSFLTKRIGEVERDMLKVKVFERSTQRVELTDVGRVIVPEIQLALRQAKSARLKSSHIALLPHSASSLSRPGVVFKPVSDRYLKIETALFARRDLMQGVLKDFAHFLASRLQRVKPIE